MSLRRAIRLALGGAVVLSAPLPASMALAQGADAEPTEEVVVIGSRIARSGDFESPSPVVQVDRESIEKSGYNNLQQLLEKIPANGNGAFSTRGNNQDSTANGAASISLRGLGADATLVLVNGRRVSVSPFAENVTTTFVDINSIPVAAIERVEILKDGASAVYGSDAVAGVVNIVLREDFQGLELSAGYGNTTESDYEETNVSAVWGTGNDTSNITLIFDYYKNDTLFNVDRGSLGSANQAPQGGFDLRSSRGYPGRFIVNGATRIDPGCPADSVAGQTCLYDYGPWNLLLPEAERTGMMLLGHTALGAGVELFAELAAQHNNSIAQGAPTPLDESALLTVPVDHPNNPYDDAVGVIQIGRYRTVDAGARQWDISSDVLRAVVGLRGTIADSWDWEVAVQRARSESEQKGDKSMGWVRTDFLQTEINAGRYNPFGGVQNPQSVIDAITTNLIRQGNSDLTMYDAQVSGKLFELAGRDVLMAVGAEYREEAVSDIPDDQFQRGLIFGTESVTAVADRENWSAFVEFSVPVLDTLELSLATRYDDYDDFGTTTNPKVAVRWAPLDSLAFRASWGTGFRAPSLAQIGLGPSQESQFFIDEYGCAVNVTYCANTDYTIIFSGNPNLQPEESESINLGVAWQPTDAINLTLDYWDIVQEDKIDEVPFGFLYLRDCATQVSLNNTCVRSAPVGGDSLGQLQSINSGFTNIGEQSANGFDLSGYWTLPVGQGNLTLGLTYSRLLEFEKVELNQAGDALIARELTGEYEYPEDRAILSGDLQLGDWGFFGQVNYVGAFQDTPDALPVGGAPNGVLDYDQIDTPEVDAWTTLNLQARFSGFENIRLLLSVDNVLDEDVPFAAGDGDADIYGYAQNVHTPRGRFWSARAIFSF
ncbi:MAG TPA: TonB-dependent receptor [Steroidobacteraceae bacterium]|nr:TonB-dependent receptor [Steroidobacteraceae bacterium]